MGTDGTITLLFLIAGHTHNIIDQRHSVLRTKWNAALELYTMDDWLSICNDSNPDGRIISEELFPFNFSGWFEKSISSNFDKFSVSVPHVFEFSTDGVRTKQYITDTDFSTWRGNCVVTGKSFEPFKILTTNITTCPKPLEQKVFLSKFIIIIFLKNINNIVGSKLTK